MNIHLHAWFDPHPGEDRDLKQTLHDKQLVGTWLLKRSEASERNEIYLWQDDVALPDGSRLRITASYDASVPANNANLSVFSGDHPLCSAFATGTKALFTVVATGKGGLLDLRLIVRPEDPDGLRMPPFDRA